jgi:hypothetical protein
MVEFSCWWADKRLGMIDRRLATLIPDDRDAALITRHLRKRIWLMRMRRRSIVMMSQAISLGIAPDLWALPPKAIKRERLSVNFRSSEMRMVTNEQKSTYLLSLPFETHAEALRIGVANTTSTSYRLDGICVSELINGNPRSEWAYLSFTHVASDEVKQPPANAQSVMVKGNAVNATGATDVPLIMWSDWIHYRTMAILTRPQMQFRVLVPRQTLPMAFPVGPGNLGGFIRNGPEHVVLQSYVEGDFVNDLGIPIPSQIPTMYAPLFVVQYRASTPGIQIVVGGDSHLTSWPMFAQLAALSLSTPKSPVSVWNSAWAGKGSNTFWPALDDAIDAGRPSLSLIQGWTANDGMNALADEAYLRRVKESAKRTLASGGIPIILKGMPRSLFGNAELESWQSINRKLDGLVAGSIVFDPNPYIEDKRMPGNWQSEFSDDQIHPNLRANQVLRVPFERLIAPLFG